MIPLNMPDFCPRSLYKTPELYKTLIANMPGGDASSAAGEEDYLPPQEMSAYLRYFGSIDSGSGTPPIALTGKDGITIAMDITP